MKSKKHSKGRRQKGGNPAILPILTAANEVAKLIKPATRLKSTRLGKVPVIGTILDTLSQMGYGDSIGPYNSGAIEGDTSQFKKRRLPIYPNEGLRSVPLGVYKGSYGGGNLQLFPF
jgi:hypothetical protein